MSPAHYELLHVRRTERAGTFLATFRQWGFAGSCHVDHEVEVFAAWTRGAHTYQLCWSRDARSVYPIGQWVTANEAQWWQALEDAWTLDPTAPPCRVA